MLKCEHCEYSQMKRGYIECPLDGCFKSQEWIDEIYNRKDNEIAEQPTADVKEVKRGHWKHTVEYGNIGKYHYWNCSLCGVGSKDEGREKFCHECGADMRGDTDGINR